MLAHFTCHVVFFPKNDYQQILKRLLGLLKVKLTSVDPEWPLHDLWSQQCINPDHRLFIPNLVANKHFESKVNADPGWPLHNLDPAMDYTLQVESLTTVEWVGFKLTFLEKDICHDHKIDILRTLAKLQLRYFFKNVLFQQILIFGYFP